MLTQYYAIYLENGAGSAFHSESSNLASPTAQSVFLLGPSFNSTKAFIPLLGKPFSDVASRSGKTKFLSAGSILKLLGKL